MKETQVIAVAGVFQAAALVRSLANRGSCETDALTSSLDSVFRLDADNAEAVFGGLQGLRLGLRTVIAQLDAEQRDLALARIALTLLRLERKLANRRDLRVVLEEGIRAAQRQADHLGSGLVATPLADLYTRTLSTLRPRVVVSGNPLYLQQPQQVERIRAALLAGVRAAVLWRQLGGRQWRLLIERRQCVMLARGLLARTRLDEGA